MITSQDYRQIIRQLMWFFEGKKGQILRVWRRKMREASMAQEYETAAKYRNQLFALEHIRDIALIQREDREVIPQAEIGGIDLRGRIEAYDISNISGTSAVGSMVVFEDGRPRKDQYRKFKIKTVVGANDVGMLEEVLRRRLSRARLHPYAWSLPVLMVIDGGEGQVRGAQRVLSEAGLKIPVIGIAKGPDRKQDRLVYDRTDKKLLAIAERGKLLFQRVRDEAHRFAVRYHRTLRKLGSGLES
jgi:excinuclease UvrABC nuclease subunit